VAWTEVYFHTKWRLHPSSRLATIGMGGCRPTPFREGELRPHLTQRCLGRWGLPPYQVAYLNPSSCLTTIDMGQILGRVVPFPIQHKLAWAEAYIYTKWHLSPSSRLATTALAENWGNVPL